MKLNKKGFTLIELLSIIVILGLVTGITITSVLGVLSNAKSKSKKLTIRNLESQAEKYVYEGFGSQIWIADSDTTEYQCVTVKDLIDAGYFKSTIIKDNPEITSNTPIKLTRDRNNKAITTSKLDLNGYNTNECNQIADSVYSKISCDVTPKGWAKKKTLTLIYNNSPIGANHTIENRFRVLNNSLQFSGVQGANLVNNEYIVNNGQNGLTPKISNITTNGSIYANTLYDGVQIGSLVCIVNEIDNTAPEIAISVLDQKVSCVITDSESKIAGYKLCLQGSCPQNYATVNPTVGKKIVTQEQASVGKWECHGIDAAGNTASSVAEVQSAFDFKMEFNANIDGAPYDGTEWTNEDVTLVGTIQTNSEDVKYYISDEGTSPDASEWINYTDVVEYTITETTGESIYYFHVQYKDGSGEYQTTYKQLSVQVDKTQPVSTSGIYHNEYNNQIQCQITDLDSGPKEYKLCKGSTNCNYSPIKQSGNVYYGSASFAYGTWYCQGRDYAGNESQVYSYTFNAPASSNPGSSSPSQSNPGSSNPGSSNSGGTKLYRQYCSVYHEYCSIAVPSDLWTPLWSCQPKAGVDVYCTYSGADRRHYSFPISLTDINNTRKRCAEIDATAPNTGYSPRIRAQKALESDISCTGTSCLGSPTTAIRNISREHAFAATLGQEIKHVNYFCKTWGAKTSTVCTQTEINNGVNQNSSGWFRCVKK